MNHQTATALTRKFVEKEFGLRTESVSMINTRYAPEYPDAPQFAVVLPDLRFEVNARLRARDEDRLLDLLTTPGFPLVEVDRTATRVFIAITA
jgi:hypothetical protein